MSNARAHAIQSIARKQPQSLQNGRTPLPELFGANVFDTRQMEARLSGSDFRKLQMCMERGQELDPALADHVATAMKEWAVDRGATHFTHWFQPMTGATAEKHDSFINLQGGRLLMEFNGKQLVKGEPDASSFPSGGLRATFEARGYTAWDPTSPAFLRETESGATLCVPTAFCSWTGEALDEKTPLLRSAEALNREALRLLRLLGDDHVQFVYPTLGCEQEYFLIDRDLYLLRPDLITTGRTLFGSRPPKGQELEDHYFGSIPLRVLSYMQDVEQELWKLGVPVKSRHNEVAPSQYELAPVFERTAVASDHNMLCMEVLRSVGRRHGFHCLLHEKPYSGINGSGKHNNWSLSTETGENLLEPGHTPAENMRFIVLLTAVIRGIDLHADLLRGSIAHAGNDHRLGANEAPPAIISIHLGEMLTEVVENLVSGTPNDPSKHARSMTLGVTTLPELPRDATDRNRTSPFAFTGNKFEFRAVGSSQGPAKPNMILNTIVAESMSWISDRIEEKKGTASPAAITEVVAEALQQHKRVIFNGNGYSAEWQEEAKRRGLPNLANAVDAIGTFTEPEKIQLFVRFNVLSARESESRQTVQYEAYGKAIAIECQTTLAMATTAILPAAQKHQAQLAQSVLAARQAGQKVSAQEAQLRRTSERVEKLVQAIDQLNEVFERSENFDGPEREHAMFYRDEVIPRMNQVRDTCDALEMIIDDALWPLPKYREMLFGQ